MNGFGESSGNPERERVFQRIVGIAAEEQDVSAFSATDKRKNPSEERVVLMASMSSEAKEAFGNSTVHSISAWKLIPFSTGAANNSG